MNGRLGVRSFAAPALLTVLAWSSVALAQQPAVEPEPLEEQTQKNVAAPCLEPPPLIRWEEYDGPFRKAIGTFASTLERKSVHPPRYKPGVLLCSLEPNDKFTLFLHDSLDPLSLLTAGFNAGLDQAQDRHPGFGHGAEGYGQRLGTNFAGQTSIRFFTDFAYPTLFAEDPRYYRLAHGAGARRFLHAVEHAFVAHRDDGSHMFNLSEWMGTTSAVLLSNAYLPGNERGFSPTVRAVGYSAASDIGFDILREFWPEIARKLRMPFRDRREPAPPHVP